jgi:hypothetical protein
VKKFEIWVRKTDGTEILAFTWTRSAESGVAKALAEARDRGLSVEDVWAVPVRTTS